MNNDDRIKKLQNEITAKRNEIKALRLASPAETIRDYTFKNVQGKEVLLSTLFNEGNELLLIQNMGQACPYCTLWADGFNGVYQHLENRIPFALVSADPWATMRDFAASRKWGFNILSAAENQFKKDTHFENEKSTLPGVMLLKKNGETIRVVARDSFGPGDPYCAVWHLFDLIPEGFNNWSPKYNYD